MGDVKQRTATYRQQQAEATKVRIADAARDLFAADGYATTSIEAIGQAAGVATRTVYAAFGTKREILNVICERWLERAGARQLAAEVLERPRALDRLRGAARWLAVLYSTDFEVVRILDSAMDEDAETRAVLHAKLRGRNRVMDSFIRSIEPELAIPLADARAVYRALAAAGVYGALVEDAGWSRTRFEEWLAGTLVKQLLTHADE
ncbi:TetR/AcrR family transcriptional regulator [Microbacterium sp.]|uniref:TetR/AcrR family transcriptional regulator n=1 Tax=Microbacterium sp. TaxID=51671 RepID=UPI003A9258B4